MSTPLDDLYDRLRRFYVRHYEPLAPEQRSELEAICDELGAHIAERDGDHRSAERLRASARTKTRPLPIAPTTPPRSLR